MKAILIGCLLIISGLLQVQAAIKPADGLWNTLDDPEVGSGVVMFTQAGITSVTVFTYDDNGRNVWLVSSGQVDDAGLYEADLWETTAGSDLLSTNPQSAQLVESPGSIRMEFSGTQQATLSINGTPVKFIRASHFGVGNPLQIPDLSGQWLLGRVNDQSSFILDLSGVDTISPPLAPVRLVARYESTHPSTSGWTIDCYSSGQDVTDISCEMKAIINEQDVLFSVPGISMGNQRISWLKDGVDSAETLQAFRLDPDNRLLPADGVWRTHDDPAIGSGIVMRTQGGVSVVLIYSYNNEGQATWQIASGQFDENGLMAAQLYAPTDGVPISNDDMTSGQVGDSGALEIQLQGTNLATLRIDGSASKTIQYYNFGLTNHDTEMFTVNEESYSFPDLVGSWVLVDDNLSTSSVWQMERYYPNCCQSPPDPNYFDSVGYTNRTWNGVSGQPPDLDFLIHLNCVKSQPPYSNYVYPELPYCYGSNFGDDENYSMKMYYEDISVNEFIYYVGPRDLQSFYGSYETINRESKRYQLFRLSTD